MAKYLDYDGLVHLWQKIKGAFISAPASSAITQGHVVVFGASGTTVQDSGFSILQDVPSASAAGFISVADQSKLNGVESGAQANIIEDIQVNGVSLTPTSGKSVNIQTIENVWSGDTMLSLVGDDVRSTLSITIEPGSATSGTTDRSYIVLKGVNNQEISRVDASDFIIDGMLHSAAIYTLSGGTWSPSTPTGGTIPTEDGTYIRLEWNTDSKKTPRIIYLNVSSLIDTYAAGNGLDLSGNTFFVKTDNTTAPTSGSTRVTLTAGANGLRGEVEITALANGDIDRAIAAAEAAGPLS